MDAYIKQVKKIPDELKKYLENPFTNIPDLNKAIEISKKYNLSLHPRYTLYWNELNSNRLITFLTHLKKLKLNKKYSILPITDEIKKFVERLGIEHKINTQDIDKVKSEDEINIIEIDELNTNVLLTNLSINLNLDNLKTRCDYLIKFTKDNLDKNGLEIINQKTNIEIRDKGGTYVGARMGRPEKAKMRKLDGRPQGLFPVGEEGGRLKNIMEAYEKKGVVTSNFAIFECENCNSETIYHTCEVCRKPTKEMYFEKWKDNQVKETHEKAVRFKKIELDIKKYINDARKIINTLELPKLVKGIKETTNRYRVVEHLSKTFLRAQNDVYVNKDGTVRFDMIEMGLTHFKPKEIGTSIDKLKELGYMKDYLGNDLINDNQLIEILPQDVILPDCTQSGDELASDFVIKTSKFVDDLLEKLYKLPRFYNFKTKEDTVGHLIIGLAPHTSAGIVGRIIGYSNTQGCFSHPVWHAAQRRNLDGDENGIMLLMDGLLNFSREYLPDRRGARTMDTSLVLTSHLYLDQIDDEVHGMDIVDHYPLEFYRANKKYLSPKEIKIEKVETRIGNKIQDDEYLGYKFTHSTDNLNNTVMCSSYKSVPLMKDKMNMQLELGRKIRAVDEHQVGSFIIDKHFMKDIKGNLRKFSMQSFRCTACNTIHRRPPLNGKCPNCSQQSINFTIHEGSIKKYLGPSFDIIKNYNVDPYIVETLELTNLRVEGVFGKELEKQKSLNNFFNK